MLQTCYKLGPKFVTLFGGNIRAFFTKKGHFGWILALFLSFVTKLQTFILTIIEEK